MVEALQLSLHAAASPVCPLKNRIKQSEQTSTSDFEFQNNILEIKPRWVVPRNILECKNENKFYVLYNNVAFIDLQN